jgi:predicted phage-related endonuclease
MLIQLESEFWGMVQTNTPPPLDGSDAFAEFIGTQFPNSRPFTQVDLPMEAAALIHQYDATCEQLEYLTDQKQEAENLLKQMLGEHEAGIIADRIITWKTVTQERLDSKAVKAKHPRIYKRFTKTKSSRRFSIKAAS